MSDCVCVMTNFYNAHTNLSTNLNATGEKKLGKRRVSPRPRPLGTCIRWLSDLTLPLLEPLYHVAIKRPVSV